MTIYSDDFERADGPLGADWTYPSWETHTFEIVNGQAVSADSQETYAFFNGGGTWGRQQRAEIEIGSDLAQARWSGAVVYGSDGGCYALFCRPDIGHVDIRKIDNTGSSTVLGANFSIGARSLGDKIAIEANDDGSGNTVLTGYLNGSSFGSRTDSSSPYTSGLSGMYIGSYASNAIEAWAGEDYEVGDIVAPTLSNATASATGATTADGGVDTDEGNGTLYWVVTASATTPSVAQIQAGQDHTGAAAADAGSQAVAASGTQSVNATGLDDETTYYFHFQHEDDAGNDSSALSSAAFTTADATAPVFTAGPSASALSETSLQVAATLDEAGTIYAVAVADGATAPSSAQVKAGQDATGSAAIAASSTAAAADTEATMSLTGLTGSTAYDVYVVAEDDEGSPNLQAAPTLTEANTLGAPTLSNPNGVATGETTADLSVDTDQDSGMLYWVVTQSATKPSVSQVQAGQDHTGAPADAAGSQAVNASGTQTASATGLVNETTYYAHFQHTVSA